MQIVLEAFSEELVSLNKGDGQTETFLSLGEKETVDPNQRDRVRIIRCDSKRAALLLTQYQEPTGP